MKINEDGGNVNITRCSLNPISKAWKWWHSGSTAKMHNFDDWQPLQVEWQRCRCCCQSFSMLCQNRAKTWFLFFIFAFFMVHFPAHRHLLFIFKRFHFRGIHSFLSFGWAQKTYFFLTTNIIITPLLHFASSKIFARFFSSVISRIFFSNSLLSFTFTYSVVQKRKDSSEKFIFNL